MPDWTSRLGVAAETASSTGEESICGLDWVRLKSEPGLIERSENPLRLVDLYCGCGGMTLGAWEAARSKGRRLDIRLAIDNSHEAIAVYRKNFSVDRDVARKADITRLIKARLDSPVSRIERKLQEQVGRVDLLVAGPPCQGHSDLNNHTRRRDRRNSLYMRVLRAVHLFQPSGLLVENVPTVVHDSHRVIERTVAGLKELGYAVPDPSVVDVSNLGLPQKRKRHLLVATRECNIDLSSFFAYATPKRATLRDYIEDIQDEDATCDGLYYTASRMSQANKKRVNYLFQNDIDNLPDKLRPPCHRDRKHSYVSMYGRLRWDEGAQTITSGFGSMGQGRYVHPARKRTITPHEAARIQGFPDFYDFSTVTRRTALHEMIANVVPPQLSAKITLNLIESKFF